MAIELNVKLQFASEQDALESQVLNISRGGVFIKMSPPRPEGTRVKIDLKIGDRHLQASGAVVRSVTYDEELGTAGIGVVFTELCPDDRAYLDSLVPDEEP